MEMLIILLVLQSWSIDFMDAVHPGCSCLAYSDTYGAERGVFNSPDFPRPYPPDIDCLLYTFVASSDEIVEITFTDFDIRKTHLDCVYGDYLKLFLHLDRAEVSEYTPWTGLMCGTLADLPPVLYSSGPGLVLEFHSAHPTANSSGFRGTFRFIDKRNFRTDGQMLPGTMCDYQFVSNEYSSNKGKFLSPRYPSNYPKNIRCSYRFKARLKERVRIMFEEVALQKGDLSCLNRADLIKVYDGRGQSSPTIGMLCNEASEVEVISSGTDLLVEFVANSDWPGKGFRAAFEFQDLNELETHNIQWGTPQPQLNAGQTVTSCDAIFNSDLVKNGSLSSPGYPSAYPPRSHCRFDFQGRGKERVQVVFSDFNLYHPTDDSKECESMDSLMAFVHIDGRMEKIDSFCGTALPKPVMSNGPRLMLEFRGIYSSRYSRGFKATYSFTENFGITTGRQLSEFPCAFVYNSSVSRNGTFSSPNFPGFYPRDTECHYFFHGLPNERVRLHFQYFDVEGVLPCEAISASDYVEFSNFMARDRKYSRHCGQLKEFDVESDRKFFRVTFRSNDRLDGTGFKATYRFFDDVELKNKIKARGDNSSANSNFHQSLLIFIIVLLLARTI